MIEILQTSDQIIFKSQDGNFLKTSTRRINELLIQITMTWGRTILKTISYGLSGLRFQINKNFFYDHIREFKLFFSDEEVMPILFKDFDIKNWEQGITFTRESTNRDWFDLSLNFEDIDIAIIQNANLEEGFQKSRERYLFLMTSR